MPASRATEGALRGRKVAITGRLSSMKRADALALLEILGAEYVETLGRDTAFLIVGEAGSPLREDGRLAQKVELARNLRASGSSIEILSETDFLVAAGLEDLHRLYTTQQLGRILKVSPARITSWVRRGLIRPVKVVRRLYYFDFAQVAGAKLLGDLVRSGVPVARIRSSLQELERWLPAAGRSLVQLGIIERGGQLLVRLRDGGLADPSGQLELDFAGSAEPARAERAPGPIALTLTRPEASWFETAVQSEEDGDLEEAAEAYQKALFVEGPRPETCFNLGNVLYGLGRREEAVQRFLQAVEIDPEYIESWNNLANALFDIGRPEEAIRALRKALAVDPEYADAHYNLAEILHQLGRTPEARAHWQAYLEQDPNSSWADHVRERLASTLRDQGMDQNT